MGQFAGLGPMVFYVRFVWCFVLLRCCFGYVVCGFVCGCVVYWMMCSLGGAWCMAFNRLIDRCSFPNVVVCGLRWMLRSVWVWFMLGSSQVGCVLSDVKFGFCIFVVASLIEVLVLCTTKKTKISKGKREICL